MANSKSRKDSRKNTSGLNWLEQIKTYFNAGSSVPAKVFFEDIFVPTKGAEINNASLSQGAIDLLGKIVKEKGAKPGDEVIIDYDDYNNFGSEMSANFFGAEENQNPDLIERLANISPADELKFTIGTAKAVVDKDGVARVDDQYDFNSWAYFGKGQNENGQYETLTPEEFEASDISFFDALKDTIKNSPSRYQMLRNIGFLMGSRDYEGVDKDTGRKVSLEIGPVTEPTEQAPTTSKRPKERSESQRPTSTVGPSEEELKKYLAEAEETQKALAPETSKRPMARPVDEDEELFSDVSKYLDNLPERELAPEESVRPMARPEASESEVSEVEEPEAEMSETELALGSVRPMARPEAEEPQMESPAENTDEMDFGEAFKYHMNNSEGDTFMWRGNEYKKEVKKFNAGGLATEDTEVDPVSGNEVPPGSLPEEVRDDVDTKLSGGEYVVPADVLRYYGLRFFEDLRDKAKENLGNLEADGRIGGEPVMEDDEGGDLSPAEMQLLQQILSESEEGGLTKFNKGGMVSDELRETMPTPTFNPAQWATVGSSYSNNPAPTMTTSDTGTEYKTFVGPNGEIQMILFLNGKAATPIPEGFTEQKDEVKEAREEANKEVEEEQLDVGSESDDREVTNDDADDSSWAERNFDAMQEDPVAFGLSSIEGGFGDRFAGQAGRIGGALAGLPGMIGGGLMGAAMQLENVSAARAAQQIAKAQGLDTSELDKKIEDYTSNFNGITSTLDRMGLASGESKANKYMEMADSFLGSGSNSSGPSPTERALGSTGTSSGRTQVGMGGGGGGESNDRPSTSYSGGSSSNTGSRAPAESSRPQSRGNAGQRGVGSEVSQSTSASRASARSAAREAGVSAKTSASLSGSQSTNPGGYDKEKGNYASGPMNKGGLVKRRKKKKT